MERQFLKADTKSKDGYVLSLSSYTHIHTQKCQPILFLFGCLWFTYLEYKILNVWEGKTKNLIGERENEISLCQYSEKWLMFKIKGPNT